MQRLTLIALTIIAIVVFGLTPLVGHSQHNAVVSCINSENGAISTSVLPLADAYALENGLENESSVHVQCIVVPNN